MIYSANQLNGFYMIEISVCNWFLTGFFNLSNFFLLFVFLRLNNEDAFLEENNFPYGVLLNK